MTEDEAAGATDPAAVTDPRIFLVVVDESPELKVALRYACLRAKRTRGRIALLYVIEPAEKQHWMAVEELIREERRTEAEQKLLRISREVTVFTDTLPAFFIREGERREELIRLIETEPTISILILAASTATEGPGPLVSYLTGPGIGKLRIPVTIVPGTLSDAELDAIT